MNLNVDLRIFFAKFVKSIGGRMSQDENEFAKMMEAEMPKEMQKAALSGFAARKVRSLPEWVEQAAERSIRVILTVEGFEVEGFYKLGNLRVVMDEKGLTHAIDKKDVKKRIENLDDLVRMNFEAWKSSREKRVQWQNPGREWLDDFMRLNLVKRQVSFIPE